MVLKHFAILCLFFVSSDVSLARHIIEDVQEVHKDMIPLHIIEGPLMTTATISGRVDLGRTQVLLPDSFGGGPPLDVTHINVEPGFVAPVAPQPSQPTATGYQAKLQGGGRVTDGATLSPP